MSAEATNLQPLRSGCPVQHTCSQIWRGKEHLQVKWRSVGVQDWRHLEWAVPQSWNILLSSPVSCCWPFTAINFFSIWFFKLYNDIEYSPDPFSPFRSACIPKLRQCLYTWIVLHAPWDYGEGKILPVRFVRVSCHSTKGEPLQNRACASWGQMTKPLFSWGFKGKPLPMAEYHFWGKEPAHSGADPLSQPAWQLADALVATSLAPGGATLPRRDLLHKPYFKLALRRQKGEASPVSSLCLDLSLSQR